MSRRSGYEGPSFKKQFEQLSILLDQLAESHQREVALAVRETANRQSRPGRFSATQDPEGSSDALLLSEANAMVPVELQAGGDDHMRDTQENSETSDEMYVQEFMGSMILDKFGEFENAPEERWARLVQQLQRPKGRVAAMKRAGFVSHPVWFIANRERLIREQEKKFSSSQESELLLKMRTTFAAVSKYNSISSWIAHTASSRRAFHWPVMHPHSKARTVWVAMSLIMILYDLVIVPIDTFFDIQDDSSSIVDALQVMSIVSCIFWSLDIVATFMAGTYIAGALVMDPGAIALAYAKRWLLFDVCLIFAQWLTTFLLGSGTPTEVQVLRGLRFLRLLRVVRLGKLQLALEQLLNVPHEGVIVCGAMLKIVFGSTLIVHVFGCVWYGVGRISDDGWARDPTVASNSDFHNYLLSVHFVATQVHGPWSELQALTTLEQKFADLSLFFGFSLFVFVVANGTLTVLHFSRTDRWKMQAACARFSDSHNISQGLLTRMQHYLMLGHRRGGISEKVKEDTELLSVLPTSVRAEAIDESRWPLLKRLQVFTLLPNLNARTVRALCQDAISVSVVLEQERVFEIGDPGRSVFIIQFGSFTYHHKGARRSRVSSRTIQTVSSRSIQIVHGPTLVWGTSVSEAVLWTKWEHAGDLGAICDSTTLVLNPESFTKVVREREDLLEIVASYAITFVQMMNEDDGVGDLFDFEIDLDTFGKTEDVVNNRHLIFLSHYKAEAGTEATLMKESLTKMICDDENNPAIYFNAPVFLDSANLQDLSLLRRSVSNSDNLVLLLTPGVLTRPWCLVEIVTALNESVRIVPVEVQRPGLCFKYPDENYYHKLANGKLLSKEDEKLLSSEGVDLGVVERSIRQVFTHIALPFSPHKSAQVRQAELSDILYRCCGDSPLLSKGSASSLI